MYMIIISTPGVKNILFGQFFNSSWFTTHPLEMPPPIVKVFCPIKWRSCRKTEQKTRHELWSAFFMFNVKFCQVRWGALLHLKVQSTVSVKLICILQMEHILLDYNCSAWRLQTIAVLKTPSHATHFIWTTKHHHCANTKANCCLK